MKVNCYINLQVKPFMIFITKIEPIGLDERVFEEAIWKVKKKLEIWFPCIETVAFARKVNITIFILMKTVILMCMGRHEGIANVETNRDRRGQKRTERDIQGQTRTSRDKHGQTGTSRDNQGPEGNVPACPCLSLPGPCVVPSCSRLSLLVPTLSLT